MRPASRSQSICSPIPVPKEHPQLEFDSSDLPNIVQEGFRDSPNKELNFISTG
jgi:hypothetical protein